MTNLYYNYAIGKKREADLKRTKNDTVEYEITLPDKQKLKLVASLTTDTDLEAFAGIESFFESKAFMSKQDYFD